MSISMNLYEEFLRCPKCDNAQFKKETIYTINKHAFNEHNRRVEETPDLILYNCTKCNHLLKQERVDNY